MFVAPFALENAVVAVLEVEGQLGLFWGCEAVWVRAGGWFLGAGWLMGVVLAVRIECLAVGTIPWSFVAL